MRVSKKLTGNKNFRTRVTREPLFIIVRFCSCYSSSNSRVHKSVLTCLATWGDGLCQGLKSEITRRISEFHLTWRPILASTSVVNLGSDFSV